MFEQAARRLLRGDVLDDVLDEPLVAELGFSDLAVVRGSLTALLEIPDSREALAAVLGQVLAAISQTAAPDTSLKNFVRYVQSVDDPVESLRFLAVHPRAVAFLSRLFVSSQFLGDMLIRHPSYLRRMTESKRLAEIKTCEDFCRDLLGAVEAGDTLDERYDAIRRVHRWELLRIAACDSFGLMDLTRVTRQLSHLADATVRSLLAVITSGDEDPREGAACKSGLAVLALGKLGGEELNYSSDIDLVLVAADGDLQQQTRVAQQLARELSKATGEGFLYRVDLRLRPWGGSGPLVSDLAGYLEYLDEAAESWERQAMIKARPIAGDAVLGREAVSEMTRRLLDWKPGQLESSIRRMKARIESQLTQAGPGWTEVKSGPGSIRDVEFVTQFLQLRHAAEHPSVLQTNTLQALKGLAGVGALRSDVYHRLSTGYLFLRSVEHALQLLHNKQVHQLPEDRGELAYLARRLDFPDADLFREHCREHCRAIRKVFDHHFYATAVDGQVAGDASDVAAFVEDGPYLEIFSQEQRDRHERLLEELTRVGSVMVEPISLGDQRAELTVVAADQPGLLSAICGLLFVYGVDIVSGHAFTAGVPRDTGHCVDVFEVRLPASSEWDVLWSGFHADLLEQVMAARGDALAQAQASLARRVSDTLQQHDCEESGALLPVNITFDNDSSPSTTLMSIEADDTIGFLYELANALSLAGVSIRRVVVRTSGDRVFDTLEVTDQKGRKIVENHRLQELQAVVVLIKHFTHLLPRSPNPESAMLQFRELLGGLMGQPDWTEKLASLEQPEVLQALSRLLGVSEFLWEDFLRLQHDNLFPVLADLEGMKCRRSQLELRRGLEQELSGCESGEARVHCLNRFKDRQMFLADMRHVVLQDRPFGDFAEELSDVTEVVIQQAIDLCCRELTLKLGSRPSGRVAVCGLGKFGGRELGFASDIELLCVYDEPVSDEDTSLGEYCRRMVERLLRMITSRRDGIFQIDMRLRPHGQAGPLAVSRGAFAEYFAPEGPAWPFERQALVKLRAVGGDERLGKQVEALRDESIYADEHFDVTAMRAMRERQVRQLVTPGTVNAKLSPGGLVDAEYLVQGLQMAHGYRCAALRTTNTLKAIEALVALEQLSVQQGAVLQETYVFHRRLIDALRMVRGDARDLAVPGIGTREFLYLARRLGIAAGPDALAGLIEDHFQAVEELKGLLEPATPGTA